MKFNIQKIKISNFLSLGDVELEFKDFGLTLIQGIIQGSNCSDSNGSGKSSIIDAFCWCLFDKTLRGISKDDIVNRFINKDCCVEIVGKVDDIPITITRYRKHKEFKNQVYLFYNENNISESTDSKTTDKISEILKMSFEDFQTNIIFSNSSIKFLELGDTDRKKLFDSIIKSDLYEKCIDKTKEKIKFLESEINELKIEEAKLKGLIESEENSFIKNEEYLNKWIEEKNNKILILQNNLENLQKSIIDDIEKQNMLKRKEECENEIIKLNKKTKELIDNKEIKEIEENMKKLRVQREFIGEQIFDASRNKNLIFLEDKLKEKRQEQSKLKEIYLKFESEIKYNSISKEALLTKEKQIDEKILNLEKNKNTCPICNQELKTEESIKNILKTKEQYLQEKENNSKEIEDICEIIIKYSEEIEKIKLEATQVKNEIQQLEEEIQNTKSSIELSLTNLKLQEQITKEQIMKEETKLLETKSKIQKNIEEYNNEIISLNKIISEIREFQFIQENLKTQIENKEEEIKKAQEQKNPFLKIIEETKNRLQDIKIQLKEEQLKTEKIQINLENNKFWIRGFKDMKGLLISTITPFMNNKAQEYLNILTNGEFSIKFVTQKENKDGTLKDVFDIEVSRDKGGEKYQGLSSGEKRRIDLTTIFVLDEIKRLNNIHNLNVRFYDEVLDSLDEIGVEKIINLLQELAKNKQLYIITHRQNLKDLFQNTLTIIKENGISKILKE